MLTRSSAKSKPKSAARRSRAVWRRILGLSLLGGVVFLWTASGFLQSSMYADDSYSKPYFVTYFDTFCFVLPLAPYLLMRRFLASDASRWVRKKNFLRDAPPAYRDLAEEDTGGQASEGLDIGLAISNGIKGAMPTVSGLDYAFASHNSFERGDKIVKQSRTSIQMQGVQDMQEGIGYDADNETKIVPVAATTSSTPLPSSDPLTVRETFMLSLKFALLWFIANWFNAACLEYTTVASSTIFSTTSSVFTLLFGSMAGVETFTARKLLGVLACLGGVFVIASADVSGHAEEDHGSFLTKTSTETLIGDALALAGAVLYGLYCVLIVKTIGDEHRVKMPVFFGFLGIINVFILWPVFLLDWIGIEKFELPPTAGMWGTIVFNAMCSLFSDLCWAYAMLFTSPLIVTIGLSLTIPLSLVGQMVLERQFASPIYLGGAILVVLSFVFINWVGSQEKGKDENADLEEDELVVELQ